MKRVGRTGTVAGGEPPRVVAWEALDASAAHDQIGAPAGGLTSQDAARRLQEFGPNRLPARRATPLWRLVLNQIRSPLVYILLVAGVASVVIGEHADAAFILAVILLNTVVGVHHEHRAERDMMALQQLLRVRTRVVRDGTIHEVDAEQVVPGDRVLLESGDRVPADLRLLSTHGLEVDESLLTGESLAVTKDATWRTDAASPVAQRHNMGHAGTVVVRGRAIGLVVATGMATEVGRIARDVVGAVSALPPLVLRMARFTRVVAIAILVAVVFIGAIGVAQGNTLQAMFFFAVALSVAAIPEGLPVALTIALGIASRRMAKRQVIIRRLPAVEGLGSCTYVASDKTGTLTCNELTVRRFVTAGGHHFEVTGEGFTPDGEVRPLGFSSTAQAPGTATKNPPSDVQYQGATDLLQAAVMCNEASLRESDGGWTWHGDPTDVALLSAGLKAGMSRDLLLGDAPMEAQIPFEPERRFSATFHGPGDGPGSVRVFVKGAPERVLPMCGPVGGTNGEHDPLEVAHGLAADGYRVLAFAVGDVGHHEKGDERALEGLRFLGFVGMIDPLRPGARDAVLAAQAAGVRVVMVTGDHPTTAFAIASELGIAKEQGDVVTGTDMDAVDEEGLRGLVRSGRVFARMAPEQKLRLVRAVQAAGHFVAVTGDGVNDAPALRAAHIGVAMGRMGTDVAREASDIVLADDNFSSIVGGIEEGRVAYDNVRKVILLLISTGAAEIVLVLLALLFESPLPLLPAQLLWLNIVTNGVQHIALAAEPNEGDVLNRGPRSPKERVFNRLMVERTLVAAVAMGCTGFVVFQWLLAQGWSVEAARNALLLLMVLFENVHLGNCRSETKSAFALSPLRNRLLIAAALGAHGIHIAALHIPLLQRVLGTGPVSFATWTALAAVSLVVVVAMELHKLGWFLRHRSNGPRSTLHSAADASS